MSNISNNSQPGNPLPQSRNEAFVARQSELFVASTSNFNNATAAQCYCSIGDTWTGWIIAMCAHDFEYGSSKWSTGH
jgi:hypothetical protein